MKIFSCTEWYRVLAQPEGRKLRVKGARGAPDPRLPEKDGKMEALELNPIPRLLPRTPRYLETEKEGHIRGWNSVNEEPRNSEKFIGTMCDSVRSGWEPQEPGAVTSSLGR